MGLVFDQVTFDGQAPRLPLVANKVTELTGLPVIATESDPAIVGTFYDQHFHFAFECAPDEQLEIHTYRPGKVREFYDEFTEGVALPTEKFVMGLNEPAGSQIVHLRGFVGLETLMGATVVALEQLGGTPLEPLTDEVRRELGGPITEEDLKQRRRQLVRSLRWSALIAFLMLPIMLPLMAIQFLIFLIMMPWRIWKAWKITKTIISQRDHEKLLRSMPDVVEFATTTPAAHEALDQERLNQYSQDLEALGFRHVLDYTVEYPGHSLSRKPPGFARLWIHPVHHCFTEVNQAFTKSRVSPMGCSLSSWLQQDWELTTSDREPMPIYFAWRRPRSLWSRHAEMNPAELLSEHLQRRRRMMDLLEVSVVTELSSDAYFDRVRKNNGDRKEVLRSKSIETIRSEMKYFEQSGSYEWSGELELDRALS